jgi:plasmid stabilization system protein ParE
MKYSVRIMPEAYDALAQNATWWAVNRSQKQAMEWFDQFIESLQSLGEMPESHSLARENVKTDYELREMLFSIGRKPTHRALFRVVGNTIQVLTIRHVSQDEWRE